MKVTALVAGCALGIMGTCSPVLAGTQNVSFAFNGKCDGMSIQIINKQTIVGFNTGCNSGGLNEGFEGKVFHLDGGKSVLVITSNGNGSGANDQGFPLTYIINLKTRSWTAYTTTNGTTQSVLNQGTLTLGATADITGAPSGRPSSDR